MRLRIAAGAERFGDRGVPNRSIEGLRAGTFRMVLQGCDEAFAGRLAVIDRQVAAVGASTVFML